MKKFGNYLLMFLMTSTLLITSCSKDDNGSDDGLILPPQQGENMMSFKIDGNNFVANEGVIAMEGEVDDIRTLIISGFDDQDRQLWITIQGFQARSGSYTIDDEMINAIYWEQDGETGWWAVPGGTITITDYSLNRRIKGTFQFNLDNLNGTTRSITEGRFDSAVLFVED